MPKREFEIGGYWLSKRPNSDAWCRTWFDPETRQTQRESLRTADIESAKIAIAEWFAVNRKLDNEPTKNIAITLILDRYYLEYAIDLPSSDMAKAAVGYWGAFWAGKMVSELYIEQQEAFIEWLKEFDLSDGYIKRIMSVGKAALRRAYKRQEIMEPPYIMPHHDGPAIDMELSLDECRAIWKAVRHPHETMYLAIAFNTLARPEAILDMEKNRVNFRDRLIVQNPIGRKQTKKYRPIVPITDALMPYLEAAEDGYLVNWHGNKVKSFKTAWRGIRSRSGIDARAVPKIIRHTVARELRRQDVPEAEIQGVLGHRAYGGETEVYAAYRPNYLGRAAKVANDFFQSFAC